MPHQSHRVPVGAADLPPSRLCWKILRSILKLQGKDCRGRRLAHHLLGSLFLFLNAQPDRTPAIYPFFGQSIRQALLGHLRPHDTPGSWHHAIQVITAAAERHPTPLTVGMRQLVREFDLGLNTAHGQAQVGQGVQACVSQPCCVTITSGANETTRGERSASITSIYESSSVNGSNGILIE